MICVYDSGVGGLTVLRALRRIAPSADVIYLGDTARVPYGNRSAATVTAYAREALGYLATLRPSLVIAACGTVSTVCLPHLTGFSFPVVGVAEAGVDAALAAAPHGRVAVLGTEATVRSRYFASRLAAHRGVRVKSIACPLLVALAEGGLTAPADPLPALVCERLLAPLVPFCPEAIVLGCTHFPWLAPHIARLFPAATLIDCGEAAALAHRGRLSAERGAGRTEYLVTDDPAGFARTARRLTGCPLDGPCRRVTLSPRTGHTQS